MRRRADGEVGERTVTITCVCGHVYEAPGLRLLKCPRCNHVWDLGNPPEAPMPLYMREMAWRAQMNRAALA